MTTSYLYDAVLSPFYDKLTRLLWPPWLHPNCITLLGGIFAFLSGLAVNANSDSESNNQLGWAFGLFTLYHMCDNMDGKHARITGKTSAFGAFFDHFVDGSVGNWVGFSTIGQVLFGVSTTNPLYWKGKHAYYCLWLSPHVISHFSGKLLLGTRWFSIDEAFLLTSAVLFAGWMKQRSLLPDDCSVLSTDCLLLLEKAVELMHVASALSVIISSLYHWYLRHRMGQAVSRKHVAALAVFLHYWWTGYRSPCTRLDSFYVRWIPSMIYVVGTENHQSNSEKQKKT